MATDDHSGSGESGENGPRRTAESADISERLQELARQLGITQAELARMLEISRQTFNPYFTGARGVGLPTLRKIAEKSGRPRLDDGDPWLAFARSEGSAPLLDRMNGEVHVYSPDRYTVVGVIVGVLVRPPRPLSA